MNKVILIVAVVVLVSGGIVWADSPEIPKAGMIAYSSGDRGNAWGWLSKYAIDGNFSPPEWQASAGPPQWLRLDLGSKYTVQEYGYARRTDSTDGYIKDFEIYVTDSDSLNPADWDARVHVGTMPSGLAGGVQHRFALDTPSVGRYVILNGINSYTNYIGAGEVWVYGTKFIVANQATGNHNYTASPTVDVVSFPTIAEPEGEMSYAITESDGEPVTWETAVPATYTFAIPNPAGPVDLWGWVKDSADPPNIICEQIQITYAAGSPTAYAKNVTVAFTGAPVSIPAAAFDNGSEDALGIHSFWASSFDDETQEESCVTFSGLGTYDVTLTVTNVLGFTDTAACTATLAEASAEPIDADVTWSGADPAERKNWSLGDNWEGGQPPINPTDKRLWFNPVGSASEGATSLMDASWSIGTLDVRNYEEGPTADIYHTLDLAANTLTANNLYVANRYVGSNSLILDWGHVQAVIKDGDLAVNNIVVAAMPTWLDEGSRLSGDLILDNVNLDTGPLASVTVGGPAGNRRFVTGTFDLTKATLADTFATAYLDIGAGGDGSTGFLLFDDGTNLRNLNVTTRLRMGEGGYARLGMPDTYELPADTNINLGVDAENRATLTMALISDRCGTNADASIVATSGGTFTAWLGTATIAERRGNAWDGGSYGTLDIRQMTNVTIDAQTIYIGRRTSSAQPTKDSRGLVYLPSGTVTANTLSIGENTSVDGRAEGLLELNGTTVTVNTQLLLGVGQSNADRLGKVVTKVQGSSAGLNLQADTVVQMGSRGRIHVVFEAEPGPEHTGVYWGLCWEGRHKPELAGWMADGRLTVEVADGVTGFAVPYYDGTNTYVALLETLPLQVIGNAITVEVKQPDLTTVAIHIDDVDSSLEDRELFDRKIELLSGGVDATAGDDYVITVNNAQADDELVIRLTYTEKADPQNIGIDEFTVTVIETTTATGSPIIWSGAATKTLMDRPEWFWGTNWQGNAAPAATTTAEVRFEDAGLGTSELTTDRTVGTLTSANTAGEHIIDLGGNRLAIPPGGTLRTGNSVGTSSMTITNGTLVLGTDEGSVDLRLGINSTDTGHVSNLKIEGTIEAYIGKLHVANARENGATLDLTQAQIQGGVLAVDELVVSSHWSSARNGFLLLGESTLTDIVVADVLTIGNAGTGRIGDPVNYDLPAGVRMQIGSEGFPATLAIGTEAWDRVAAPADGRLVATSGGSFEAWLTTMDVATRGTNPWGWHTNGIVDLRPMGAEVTINSDATQIGVRNTTHAVNYDCIGSVYLGGGTLTTGSLAIGQNSSGAYGRHVEGLLQLENGAKATVSDSFIIGTGESDAGSYGRVVSLVGGSSTGLHIEAGATVEIGDRAMIEVTFSRTPSGSGLFWGLRWGGDHVLELEDMVADGRLVITDDVLGNKAEIFLAGADTYIGIKTLEGDANFDCKVNILDLIFIRNRLNQSVETGDNWQADVNGDSKINILDLIYVRNRLNTKCPG